MQLNSFERINWVSNSNDEPNAMLKNCRNSLLDFLPQPSAMFDGIETAARVICDIKPNLSDCGKSLVISNIVLESNIAAFHTFNSLKLCILNVLIRDTRYLILRINSSNSAPAIFLRYRCSSPYVLHNPQPGLC